MWWFEENENPYLSPIQRKLSLTAARDDQDLVLVVAGVTGSHARVTQDLEIVVAAVTGSHVRVTQDLEIVVAAVTGSHVRVTQDLLLVIVPNIPFTAQLEPHFEDHQYPWARNFQGIQQGLGEEDVIQPTTPLILITFVSS